MTNCGRSGKHYLRTLIYLTSYTRLTRQRCLMTNCGRSGKHYLRTLIYLTSYKRLTRQRCLMTNCGRSGKHYLRTLIYLTSYTRLTRQTCLMMNCGRSGKQYPKIFLNQMRNMRANLTQGSWPPKRDSNQEGVPEYSVIDNALRPSLFAINNTARYKTTS